MKKSNILFALALLLSTFTFAQVGIGTTIPDDSAALDITSTTAGLLPPRMTTADRDLINTGTPAEGLTIYNTDTKCLELYNGTDWISVCDGSVVTTPPPTCDVSDGVGGFLTFMCHNLGADTSLDPNIPVVGLQGGYVKWGLPGPANWVGAANDGSNGFAAAPTSSDSNSAAITGWGSSPPINTSSWNSGTESAPVKVTANDPCPTGFRVPTRNEWTTVIDENFIFRSGTFSDSPTNYGVVLQIRIPLTFPVALTLPAAGYRENFLSGGLVDRGNSGAYWTSEYFDGNGSYLLSFDNINEDPGNPVSNRSGASVRCIAE
jgi:uncharacterized protein (TIGR02145 family)